jgi:membrane protein DedA with SNARE-associated domain
VALFASISLCVAAQQRACFRLRLTLHDSIHFLIQHGYVLLFIWVLVEQIGLPLPAIPLLLAAGALAGSGRMNLTLALGIAMIAALLSDLIWFHLGRYRGSRVLKLLCRISLEPDSCVRRTENMFARQGAQALLIAKFIPGLNTAAPALAGIFRMSVPRFLLFDGLGAFLWVATFAGLGFIFTDQLERIASYLLRWGSWLVVVLGGSLAAYILLKYIQRQRFLHRLRTARITPQELMDTLRAGTEVLIVDLRQPLDVAALPQTIPGAVRMAIEELEMRHQELPRDRDVVLYCS